jgi:Spy/CpxP family protein refolding chaperone
VTRTLLQWGLATLASATLVFTMSFGDLVPVHAAAGPSAVAGLPPSPQAQGRSGRPSGNAPGPVGWKWWSDPEVKQALGLSDAKSKKIEDMYQERLHEAQPWVDEYLRQNAKLQHMTADRVADEETYRVQVSRVESLRARLIESRTVMIYQFFRELTPDQYKTLQDITERKFHSGGRDRGPGSRH